MSLGVKIDLSFYHISLPSSGHAGAQGHAHLKRFSMDTFFYFPLFRGVLVHGMNWYKILQNLVQACVIKFP